MSGNMGTWKPRTIWKNTMTSRLTANERDVLEDRLWAVPELRQIEPDDNQRGFMLEDMTDEELISLAARFDQPKQEQAQPVEQVKPKPEPVERSRERAPRVKRVESVKLAESFVEKNGKLYRREVWTSFDMLGNEAERTLDIPCGQRVRWEGRLVSASIVLHWLRTGDVVKRLPRDDAKPYRARIRSGGRLVHLGYFATAEERDAAIFSFKLGLTL